MLRRICWGLMGAPIVIVAGCGEPPRPMPVPTAPAAATDSASPDDPAPSKEPASETAAAGAADAPSGPTELKLETISFMVPGTWKSVKPANNIIEAEYELPRAAGDEYDGRLTLMSSGGNPEETIATRTAEFSRDADDAPQRETLKIGSIEATWVDLRGTWSGSSFQPLNPPRPEYRMVLVIIPFTERSAFYAKLVGPKETIATRIEEFREFLKSARLKPR